MITQSHLDQDAAIWSELDRVIEWGAQYGIHININFCRAPGFVNWEWQGDAAELWTKPRAQNACAIHWAAFAQRYRGIPNDRLSFNLWNEPPDLEPSAHAAIVRQVVKAIRQEDPNRLVIADGRNFASTPCPELVDLGIAQSLHCYKPPQLTHYLATWMPDTDEWTVPVWPRPTGNGLLRGPSQGLEGQHPLVIGGSFQADTELSFHVGNVFRDATLTIEADGVEVLRKAFPTGPESEGDWKSSDFLKEYDSYLCNYDRTYLAILPATAKDVVLRVEQGNWLHLTRLGLTSNDQVIRWLDLDADWDSPPSHLRYDGARTDTPWITPQVQDRKWLKSQVVIPWKELAARQVGLFVGEFGVFNRTPHDVTLRWMEDVLAELKEADWGWALWNFDGPFGILDSGRSDVHYEDWHGHKLDRKMLELLQRY